MSTEARYVQHLRRLQRFYENRTVPDIRLFLGSTRPRILTKPFCRASLYGVTRVSSDTRERLDKPRQLRRCFTKMFQLLQRGSELKGYTYGHYVLSIDGAGCFSLDKTHCQNCCEKHRRDGAAIYYHVGSRSGAPGTEEGFSVWSEEGRCKKE